MNYKLQTENTDSLCDLYGCVVKRLNSFCCVHRESWLLHHQMLKKNKRCNIHVYTLYKIEIQLPI